MHNPVHNFQAHGCQEVGGLGLPKSLSVLHMTRRLQSVNFMPIKNLGNEWKSGIRRWEFLILWKKIDTENS